MNERIPPQNLEAEQSVLGSMMLSKEAIILVLHKLQPESFYRDAHSVIFKAIESLYQRHEAIDIVTVSSELKKMDSLDVAGGKAYLAEVASSVPTAANAEDYAEIVQEKFLLRKLIEVGGSLVQHSYEDADQVEEIINTAQREINDISKETISNDLVKLGNVVGTVWDNINDAFDNEDNVIGVPTGFSDLDALTSGFQRSDLVIIAARPAMGKTALVLNFAMRAAIQHKQTVAFFSLEMPKEQLAMRMLAAEAMVDMSRLKTANLAEHDYKGLSQALGRLSEADIYIDDTPSISPTAMRAKLRRLMAEREVGMVIIDYMQLMRSAKRRVESRFQEVSEIVRDVKGIAKELNVPILALSQLSRDVEKRGGDVPKLSDLRESGEIEQTADMVMFIHRDDYYEQSTAKVSPTKLVIAKHRNGPTGEVNLVFRKNVSRFEQAAAAPAPPPPGEMEAVAPH